MNKRQIEVQKANLGEEKKIIRQLKLVYSQARKDCEAKIRELGARTDMQNLQTIVYQIQYQKALQQQIDGILDTLQNNQFEKIADYLGASYENGFVGALYVLHGQGIPLIFPIDQSKVVKALQTDAKLSEGLYSRLGEDTAYLKKSIRAELSRGAARGSSWLDIAAHIANGMNNPFDKAINNAIRIARTEGHRIQQQSQLDTLNTAKDKGADVVKQWDSTLDGRTRETHRLLDGQIREVDEPFESAGMKSMYPGGFGRPSEDCNCRCCMLQRAKWALDADELKTLQDRAKFFGLDKSADFEDFKEKYLHLPQNADTMKIDTLQKPIKSDDEKYAGLMSTLEERLHVPYNPVKPHDRQLTDDEIIEALSGGDKTTGSCASLGLAYIGQRQGWDVLDFRGGESQHFFSNSFNLKTLSQAKGVKALTAEGKSSITVGNRLLKQCEVGKEYYLCVGRHASIIRKLEDGTLQYLELQSATRSGWTDFNGNPKNTLYNRFGCRQSQGAWGDFMIDIDESDFSTDDFKSLLGYINTDESEQKKGKHGTIK